MSQKTVGYVLVVVGVILLVVGLFADPLGLGPVPGYGWKQIPAIVIGAIAVVAGVLVVTRKPR